MKALEKEPSQRYASAAELAADVSRHLASDPIVARPSSLRSRARRVARRYQVRSRVAAAGSAVLLLAICAAGLWAWMSTPAVALTVTKPIGGTIIGAGLVCGTHGVTCATKRPVGETVELLPVADPGYVFARFVGDCPQNGPVSLLQPKSFGATFNKSTASRCSHDAAAYHRQADRRDPRFGQWHSLRHSRDGMHSEPAGGQSQSRCARFLIRSSASSSLLAPAG